MVISKIDFPKPIYNNKLFSKTPCCQHVDYYYFCVGIIQ